MRRDPHIVSRGSGAPALAAGALAPGRGQLGPRGAAKASSPVMWRLASILVAMIRAPPNSAIGSYHRCTRRQGRAARCRAVDTTGCRNAAPIAAHNARLTTDAECAEASSHLVGALESQFDRRLPSALCDFARFDGAGPFALVLGGWGKDGQIPTSTAEHMDGRLSIPDGRELAAQEIERGAMLRNRFIDINDTDAGAGFQCRARL